MPANCASHRHRPIASNQSIRQRDGHLGDARLSTNHQSITTKGEVRVAVVLTIHNAMIIHYVKQDCLSIKQKALTPPDMRALATFWERSSALPIKAKQTLCRHNSRVMRDCLSIRPSWVAIGASELCAMLSIQGHHSARCAFPHPEKHQLFQHQ